MSAAPPQELLKLWARDQLSTEMATGQILQHLTARQATLEVLKLKVNALQTQIEGLSVRTETVSAKGKKRPA